jgi:N6-adenosine-specific RNA methylase IME4
MEIDSTVLASLPLALRIEIEENALRKDLTQSELAEQQERILAALRERTQQGRRTDLEDATSGKAFPQVEVRATDAVGRIFGESRKQVEKRLAVVKAARDEPERFGKLAADMDRTGLVNGPFKRLKNMRQAEAIRAEPPPMPNKGPYRVITADPPWPFEIRDEDPSHRAVYPYPTMTIAQICAKGDEVRAIASKDCILWLWTACFHARHAYAVLDAWGFEERTTLTWVKDRIGYGDWLRNQTEHVIMAIRGKPIVSLTNESTALFAPVGRHSEKPDAFYRMVEKLCPAPRYAELFSRRSQGPNWDGHGDEHPSERAS